MTARFPPAAGFAGCCVIVSLPCPSVPCRGQERGVARPEVLQALLGTTDRVVQEVDSVEYGLTDIQVRVCSCEPSSQCIMTSQPRFHAISTNA